MSSLKAIVPKHFNLEKLGNFPKSISNGDLKSGFPFVGDRFFVYTAHINASAHNVFGRPDSNSIVLILSMIKQLKTSLLPFC